MSLASRLVDLAESGLVALLCRVDDAQMTRVPATGPLILVTNHVGNTVVAVEQYADLLFWIFFVSMTGFGKWRST